MSPHPPNTYPAAYPDARIDQVLTALRTTEPPPGLEERVAQRIAARLALSAEARTLTTSPLFPAAHPASPSFFAVILNAVKDPHILLAPARRYSVAAAALTLLLALTTITLLHHRTPATTAHTTPIVVAPPSSRGLEGAGRQSYHRAPTGTTALAAEAISNPLPPSAQDLDTIALAETLAPSHPAPPLPLTAQEHLMLVAMRPGQPIQLAELDLARAPTLRAAAESREATSIQRYVKSLLAPLAVADELSPTTDSQAQETPTPPPPPPPSNSSSN
jgi:hypothetical protein